MILLFPKWDMLGCWGVFLFVFPKRSKRVTNIILPLDLSSIQFKTKNCPRFVWVLQKVSTNGSFTVDQASSWSTLLEIQMLSSPGPERSNGRKLPKLSRIQQRHQGDEAWFFSQRKTKHIGYQRRWNIDCGYSGFLVLQQMHNNIAYYVQMYVCIILVSWL